MASRAYRTLRNVGVALLAGSLVAASGAAAVATVSGAGAPSSADRAFVSPDAESPEVDSPAPVPEEFTVSGSGWGHGVGMSQYGAMEMANDGYRAGEILRHYYQGTEVATVDADRDIRVEIFGSGSDNLDRVIMVVRSVGYMSDGQWRMRFYDSESDEAHTTWTGTKDEFLVVERSGNSTRVTRDDGTAATATHQVEMHWEGTRDYQPYSLEDAYVELIDDVGERVTHGRYSHGRLLVTVPQIRLIVSNEVLLNTEYLYGIAEVPSSWHMNVLQAQAIVARGYALRQAESYSVNCNCHLYDDTRSQYFKGWNKQNPGGTGQWGERWKRAVDGTNFSNGSRGTVLTYNGNIATTYYFSSSGGQTENSEVIWASQPGYLTSVEDPGSRRDSNPNRNWTRTLTQAEASAAFGLPDVVDIRVTERSGDGEYAAAVEVTATSSTGQTATMTGGDRIRIRLASGMSPWVWSFTPQP